ncbi:hypothetical protein [Streptomyces sp. NPDC059008]|uniref:hypothetical protein n=1 Tax=unclassified Streptomyces TaxID=2593676 RepID=UPI0036A2D884
MSDSGDGGSGGDNSYDAGGATRSGSGSGAPASLDVIRRAMRWETLVIVLILVLLTVVAS